MTGSYTVGDLVAEFLARLGVTDCFGIISVHNIPMLDAIARRNAIRYVMARNEMGAAHMADAYARVSGGLGVVFSSTGPGAANAMGGLVEARFGGSPVLHLTGQTASRFAGRDMGPVHDVPGQSAMLAAVCKAQLCLPTAEAALGFLTRAATLALTPPMGPVTLEIPIDLQRIALPRPAELDGLVLPLPPPPEADAAALDALAERLAAARRPMLWLGNGAKAAGAGAAALLGLGFGAVSSWNGRGIVDEDHPMSFGALHGNGAPRIEAFYRSVDAMLVVGSRLRGHETLDFSLKLPQPLYQIDIDPAARNRTYPTDFFLCGDAERSLQGLASRLRGRLAPAPAFADEVRETKRQAVADYAATLGPYAGFPAAVRAALPRDALWVRDITLNNSSWGNRIMPVHGPRDAVHPVGAAIGPGLPFGIGAALAGRGRKAVAMVGDGGFALNMAELFTAAQERLELVVLVMNDRGYGVIKHIQGALQEGRMVFGDLQGPDFQALAGLAGMPAFKVSRAADLEATLRQACATPGPSLVEVDMTAIGAFPPYAPYNNLGIYRS
jgi:acetolactate synthase-1/2/3 large subunit